MVSQSIKDKLKALLSKTTAAGCTEEEAMAAASKAAELMRRYGIERSEVFMDQAETPARAGASGAYNELWSTIAWATNTAPMRFERDRTVFIKYHGIAPGPDVAGYLHIVCGRAVRSALRAFKKGTYYRRRKTSATRRRAAHEFTSAMIRRLSQRIVELFADLRNDEHAQAAKQFLSERFDTVAIAKRRSNSKITEASRAGFNAGADVSLNRGVNSSGGQKMLA